MNRQLWQASHGARLGEAEQRAAQMECQALLAGAGGAVEKQAGGQRAADCGGLEAVDERPMTEERDDGHAAIWLPVAVRARHRRRHGS